MARVNEPLLSPRGRAGLDGAGRDSRSSLSQVLLEEPDSEPFRILGTNLEGFLTPALDTPLPRSGRASRTDRSENNIKAAAFPGWRTKRGEGGLAAPRSGPLSADGEKCPKVFEVRFSGMKFDSSPGSSVLLTRVGGQEGPRQEEWTASNQDGS